MATKAEIAQELSRTKDELLMLKLTHEEFRSQVRTAAHEVADEQGWCYSGLNERLEELGLEKVAVSHRRKVLIEVEYEWDGDEEPGIGRIEITQPGWNTRLNITDWAQVSRNDVEDIYE
jgi:hypothetical protein